VDLLSPPLAACLHLMGFFHWVPVNVLQYHPAQRAPCLHRLFFPFRDKLKDDPIVFCYSSYPLMRVNRNHLLAIWRYPGTELKSFETSGHTNILLFFFPVRKNSKQSHFPAVTSSPVLYMGAGYFFNPTLLPPDFVTCRGQPPKLFSYPPNQLGPRFFLNSKLRTPWEASLFPTSFPRIHATPKSEHRGFPIPSWTHIMGPTPLEAISQIGIVFRTIRNR